MSTACSENDEMGNCVIYPADAFIEGVKVLPLQQIRDQRGAVYHMLKATDSHFQQFGEVYFSTIYPGVVKAWKNHRRVTVNFACIFGCTRIVLYDGREASRTCGALMEIILGTEHYCLVVIPPGVWNGFQGLSAPHAIICNCATEPTNPSEYERIESSSSRIPYTWKPAEVHEHV